MSDLLKRKLLACFEPRPLRTPEQSELRVELDQERSSDNGVAAEIVQKIIYATKASHHLLAGHRGSGKSTELLRVQDQLQSGQSPIFTVYADLSEDLDLNDVDLLDVLVAIVRHLADDLRNRFKIELKPGYFRDRLLRLWRILASDIELSSLDVATTFGKLAIAIKGSPDAREKLRKAFEPDAGNWIDAVNDVLDQALLAVREKGFQDLCIIVDDLDKLTRVKHSKADCSISENLFVNRAPQLTGLHCHVVYSIPLELAISQSAPTLQLSYSGPPPVIPMVKVRKRPPLCEEYPAGIERLRDVVDRRCHKVGCKLTDLCDLATLNSLILLSGGQPSEMMALISDCILRKLPFDQQTLQLYRVRGEREYQFLRRDHWTLLESVKQTGVFERTSENENAIRELLESRAILQYVNDSIWYRPNPYIEAGRGWTS
jgi:hypothetical protein